MTPLEVFQKQHGQDWAKITRSPCFEAAMQLLNVEKVSDIAAMDDETMSKYGLQVLADLRGHLKHERALLTLHEERKFVFSDLPNDTYESEIPTVKPDKRKK